MKRWMAILLAASVLIAGCADDADEGDDAGNGGDAQNDQNQTGNVTVDIDGNATANHPPEAALTIDVLGPAGNHTRFNVTVSDPDGDGLTGHLDADGDGEAEVNGTQSGVAVVFFEAAGNYTATLTVSDGNFSANATLEFTIEAATAEDAGPVVEDRGWYVYDPATELCHVKDFEDLGGLGILYRSALSGGDWVLAEDNGEDGLQVADNHPVGDPLFGLDVPGCTNGDLIVV